MWIFWLLIVALLVFIAIFLFVYFSNKKRLLDAFRRQNVFVFGKKGTGKDLLFQYVIKNRKKKYYSNIPYGYDYMPISPNQLSLAPNTYDNLISGDIVKVPKNDDMERIDIYLSEAGLMFPSQYDTKLSKVYSSFPLYYALTRHLYNSNVHINAQCINRVWLKLREQADYYIKCERTYNFGLFLVVRYIEYDKYESALNNLLPIKVSLFNKFSRAEVNTYRATNGFIKRSFIIVPKLIIKYDTRAFEKIFFDKK